MKLIDKAVVVAEIEKKLQDLIACKKDAFYPEERVTLQARINMCKEILSFLETLEVKEDNLLTEIEKELADSWIGRIDKKRIPIELKGELKAKFKNEFHTMWQTVGALQFANAAKHIMERLCLHFSAWGAYNLKDIGKISLEERQKMDVEIKNVDLEKIIDDYFKDWKFDDELDIMIKPNNYSASFTDLKEIAKHFFELGLYSQLSWQDIRKIAEIGEEFMNSEESDNLSEEEYYTAILDKLKEKGRDYKTDRQEIRDLVQKGE